MPDVIYNLLHVVKRSEVISASRDHHLTAEKVQEISAGTFLIDKRDEVKASGCVVHTLAAALWAFFRTSTSEDEMYVRCVRSNLAAYYGFNAIPARVDALEKEIVSGVVLDLVHEAIGEPPPII
jgi:hypothetical protein